ncbi:volume-regulated anion channel subunit LRRC8A-like [Acropora millepora]|uniref:volume-regulated anion channel subunit LRRC8A-like n=1 Tax=Acropora millepora TaxID=45264 RepID=UPI001CF475CF|nr:volume-regulated anion channel subunit LRRC8A-like [Acropora millepora]
MDLEKPKLDTAKLLTTWWDLVDHYVLAVMFAVSLASVGLQTTQDRLICIPAINCSNFARNDPVVHKLSELRNVSNICNRSPSYVVLTTMPDRRQYDYVDNECYKEIHWFSAYYSLIFLAEAAILLAISSFWRKCPDSANALAHCEQKLSESMMKELTDEEQPVEEEQERKIISKKYLKKMSFFLQAYSDKITIFSLSSVTGQYRLRGVVGLILTIAMLILNAVQYSLSTEWTQCHLDGHRFFQCTRSMATYFHILSVLLFVFLSLHLVFAFVSFVWSVTGQRRGPKYCFSQSDPNQSTVHGDAAFLLHLLLNSNYGIVRK